MHWLFLLSQNWLFLLVSEWLILPGSNSDADVSGANANLTPRVAVFAQDITTANAGTLASTDCKMIYSVSGAQEFTNGNAVTSATALGAVTKNGAMSLPVSDPSVTGYNAGTYYKITVRMWLEGEDTTCNNTTFAQLTDKWSLDMAWSLADENHTSSVEYITASDTPTKTTATGVTVNDSDATNIILDGETYYATNQSIDSNTVYTLSTTINASSRYFTYADKVLKEITNQVSYTAD